jgi:hypothetical protein
MFRIDNFTAIPGPPNQPPPISPVITEPPDDQGNGGRYFAERAGANPATLFTQEWFLTVQEELCQLVTGTGVLLQKDPALHAEGPFTQVATAIKALCEADTGGPVPPGDPGNSIEEPDQSTPADPLYYSRNRDDGETDGYWTRAIDEPLDDGFDYNRAVPSGQTPAPPLRPYGEWRRSGGLKPLKATDVRTFFVRKAGSNANSGTSEAQAWATIQYAVDFVTMNIDANAQVVTIDVGPSEGTPWAGFHARRPLTGAPPHGFKIVGQPTSPNACEIGPMPRMTHDANGAEVPVPGVFERYTVRASNGAKIAISGFLFALPIVRDNIFVQAAGNSSAVSIEAGIIFYPKIGPPIQNADVTDSTYANLQAIRGAIIYCRATHTIRPTVHGAGPYPTAGRRTFSARNGGKILVSPGVTVAGEAGHVAAFPIVNLETRSIMNWGLTGGLSGVWNQVATPAVANDLYISGNSITSNGNDWELMNATALNQGTRGPVLGSASSTTQSAYGSTCHTGTNVETPYGYAPYASQ